MEQCVSPMLDYIYAQSYNGFYGGVVFLGVDVSLTMPMLDLVTSYLIGRFQPSKYFPSGPSPSYNWSN